MAGIIDKATSFFMGKSVLIRFVIINIAVFFALHIMAFAASLSGSDFAPTLLLALPASFAETITRPWTILTYMFTHYDVFHILLNMLWLYCFGIVFLDNFTNKDFVTAYISGGVAGAVFYIAGSEIFTQIGANGLIGASAATLSVATATIVRAPNYRISLLLIGMVKIKWIGAAFIIITLLTAGTHNIGGHIAHLGGIATGFVFATGYKHKWWDKTNRQRKKAVILKPLHSHPVNEVYLRQETEKELDDLLIKIKQSGYNSLSEKEKKRLTELSKKI